MRKQNVYIDTSVISHLRMADVPDKNDEFTVDDIHRIRYENYERTRDVSACELIERTKQEAAAGLKRLAELRQEGDRTS